MPKRHLRKLRNLLGSPKALAAIPIVVLSAYLFGGEVGLVAIALLLPALLAFAGSLRQPIASGHVRDPLTGLIMRDGLIDWVERALPRADAQGCQVAVMSITIDDLDTLEARFGRAMHDTVIREAVQRMRNLLREDDIVARLGQAIAIGMDNVRLPENESLMQMAERIKHAFEEPFCEGPTRTYCTVSIGIAAESHVRSSSGANIVAGAQRASELAIVSGAGSIRFYSGGLSSDEALHRNTARELNNALETNEIFAWFQPQVRIADGKVIGFEALARWDHPDRGLVSPASFLPDLERAGLSQRLAEVILKQSLMALNVWDAAGYDVPAVSVNFSSEELRNPRLPDFVRWELDRHEIAPERLVVEVLESVASDSGEDAITRTLHALSRIGCHIDLDDFGTGFTSFLNIRRFEVDRIKIDRSLVNKIDSDDRQHSMFAALLAFGDKLGIETLAEGVETEEEARVLAELGCRDMQGYAICRPLPLGESMLWLEDRGEFRSSNAEGAIRDSA